ncbi:MAG: QueT transporter family protein [Lachnospiraceae bacterium]
MKKNKIYSITQAAAIAAVYVVLTFAANALGLSNGVIQVRFSEALTILPYFTPLAVPGLFVGCIISNLLTGCMPLDVIFGSLATLAGAVGTALIGKLADKQPAAASKKLYQWLAPLPPIIANTLVVPFILSYVYQFEGSISYFMLTVGIGEVISCGVLGLLLLFALEKYRHLLFPREEK